MVNIRMVKKAYNKKRSKKCPTKKEVRSIAKSVIKGQAESKYFNTQGATSLTELAPVSSQLLSNMTVYGFVSGKRTNSAGTNYQYGSGSMQTLNINRLYSPSDVAPLDQFALEGLYCSPQFAQSRWVIERNAQSFSNVSTSPNRACPYFVRILRIQPRTQKSSNQDVEPNLDAFLDVNGLSTGVFVAGFTKLDLLTLKPNTRKYKVIQDIKFMMNSPVQSNVLDIDTGTTNVRTNTESTMRTFNFSHDIGKKLYYKEPGATSQIYPSSGFKNEFILYHFQVIGDNGSVRESAADVRISANAVSSFKDF